MISRYLQGYFPHTQYVIQKSPTLYAFQKVSLKESNVTLVLRTARRYLQVDDTNCTVAWQKKVERGIEREVRKVVPRLETLETMIFNPRTDVDNSAVSLIFDVLIEIRSPVLDHDIYRYIQGPFDTQEEKDSFARFLRSTGCPQFVNVGTIDVLIPEEEMKEASVRDADPPTALIIGLSVAIAAMLLLVAIFVFVRIRRNHKITNADVNGVTLYASDDNKGDDGYASEIGVGSSYDVSTLGDPLPPEVIRLPEVGDASTMGSHSLDYDFQKAYVGACSTTDSIVTNETCAEDSRLAPSLLGAEETFATTGRQFEVIAPSGLLGLILESSYEDGQPSVHSIKPNSVLAIEVEIGDRLLSVDGEDITMMQASEVSRLIASKKDQASRVFVFSRQRHQGSLDTSEPGW